MSVGSIRTCEDGTDCGGKVIIAALFAQSCKKKSLLSMVGNTVLTGRHNLRTREYLENASGI
ncbi:hypothetical protein [Candidatus Coxiella mudrowiae]|uniref:hypothetical protein n=1 Tax=Candidatus Coxiella mudrowiae TaxID=2054173 RepID=UPI0012FEF928|nr:hypothetical protein [Candidatus Coxiella mudrowiae]